MRPLWYEFPQNEATFDHQDSFLLGPALLVAPVTDANATSVRVWLPAGTQWRHFSTNQSVAGSGGEVELAAPIGQPCALWLV